MEKWTTFKKYGFDFLKVIHFGMGDKMTQKDMEYLVNYLEGSIQFVEETESSDKYEVFYIVLKRKFEELKNKDS